MTKKKGSAFGDMAKLGMNVGVSNLAISALPSNKVTENVSEGYAKFSGVFPAYGKLLGTGVVIKQGKNLLKSTKKLKL